MRTCIENMIETGFDLKQGVADALAMFHEYQKLAGEDKAKQSDAFCLMPKITETAIGFADGLEGDIADYSIEIEDLHDFSYLLERSGENDDARKRLRKAATLAEQQKGLVDIAADVWAKIGLICDEAGKTREARQYWKKAYEMAKKYGADNQVLATVATQTALWLFQSFHHPGLKTEWANKCQSFFSMLHDVDENLNEELSQVWEHLRPGSEVRRPKRTRGDEDDEADDLKRVCGDCDINGDGENQDANDEPPAGNESIRLASGLQRGDDCEVLVKVKKLPHHFVLGSPPFIVLLLFLH